MVPSPHEPSQRTAFYARHFSRLAARAMTEFGIPENEAVTLAHDVLLASLYRTTTTDIDSWLDGALRCAAQQLAEVRS
jgi:hypothetical protein